MKKMLIIPRMKLPTTTYCWATEVCSVPGNLKNHWYSFSSFLSFFRFFAEARILHFYRLILRGGSLHTGDSVLDIHQQSTSRLAILSEVVLTASKSLMVVASALAQS